MRLALPLLLVLCAALAWHSWAARATARALTGPTGWITLPTGLERGVFEVDPHPEMGDGRIVVLRIDPKRFALRLVTRAATGRDRTAAEWLDEDAGLLAAINATMYEADGRASSLLVADGVPNNDTLGKDNSVLTFGDTTHIVDRTCEPLERLPNLVQGIRMLGCDGENVWAEQPRAWSEAAIGEDRAGNILFLFARTPWTMHTFVDHIRGLDIGVTRLQHADGGPPAQLAWRDDGGVVELLGSYETGARERDDNALPVHIPNLLGVVPR